MVGGSAAALTAVPPAYREIDFIGDFLFRRFLNSESESSLPNSTPGRVFTLPDDAPRTMAVAAVPPLPVSACQMPKQSPKHYADTDLRGEINELLQSLNLKALSPEEEQHLQRAPALQVLLEPSPTTESPIGSAQPANFGNSSSAAPQEQVPSRRQAREIFSLCESTLFRLRI